MSADTEVQKSFQSSARPHILMITNHGVHEWQVIPGLPDTGGQNVFVNHFSEALAAEGFRITIANRGGYPHPETGKKQAGLHYKDHHQRLVYLEDGADRFVRKEDMREQIPELAKSLQAFVAEDGAEIDLIVSHYWDAALLAEEYLKRSGSKITHVWVPHSLGAIKKRNVSSEQWQDLRIDERILVEENLVRKVPAIAATSPAIRESLVYEYHFAGLIPFLPPCVDPGRFYPRKTAEDDPVWQFLSEHSALSPNELRDSKIVIEISRTDRTKRKDVLIRAFAGVLKEIPEGFLIVSIDESHPVLARELFALLEEQGVRKRTAAIGSVWEILPSLYGVSDVYCTPSVMEGFGMAVQEAAASGVPAVASHLVPYAREYLLGDIGIDISPDGPGDEIVTGEGAMIVRANDVDGFIAALVKILRHEVLRTRMGERAYAITIPDFTWKSRTQAFLQDLGMNNPIGH